MEVMATPAKKVKLDDNTCITATSSVTATATTVTAKRPCPYGTSCYRKNPLHFVEFSHPGDVCGSGISLTDDGSIASSSSSMHSSTASSPPIAIASTTTAAAVPLPTASGSSPSLPPCKYGAKCYRKNLLHFAEYSHPTLGPVTTPAEASDDDDKDGNDTDVYDSESDNKVENKDDASKDRKGDILSRGMSLMKSYSQMTEEERKELIRKAFEAKQQLQQELEATKKRVAEKDRELQQLQEKVNKGLMLMEGEEEALRGDSTVYFPLMAERSYKEGSPDQIHFRLAESQFYRLLTGQSYTLYRVTKVEYVITPQLVKRFKKAREKLRAERGEDYSYPVLAFHGTDVKNITSICENGFKVPGESGFHHKTDTGWYGAGVYFSEYPSYSMGYISGASELLLCQVLPGKVFECKSLIHGASLTKGHDSHMSPCKKELVIFNSHHILPSYLVHYTNSSTEFKYQTVKAKKPHKGANLTSADDLKKKKAKALKAAASDVLDGLTVKYLGPKNDETEFYKLIQKHHGIKGTNTKFTLVVAHQDFHSKSSKIVEAAINSKAAVVTMEYIYETITEGKQLDTESYLHSCMFD